jgi:hypothetical protein
METIGREVVGRSEIKGRMWIERSGGEWGKVGKEEEAGR